MAKDISIQLKFDSNGQTVLGQLTVSAKELQSAMRMVQKQSKSTFKDFLSGVSAAMVSIKGATDGISNLAQPYMAFDQAMRTANTMAGKGAKEFEQLKDKVKALSKEVPVARDALANGLYQVISNGVPESNWMSFLEQSAKSSVGGVADLGEVVKVTSTVIKIAIFVSRNSTNILQKSTDSMATFKAEVYAHQKRADGTYNVKIRITHNQRKKYLATQWYVSKDDLTRSLKIKN